MAQTPEIDRNSSIPLEKFGFGDDLESRVAAAIYGEQLKSAESNAADFRIDAERIKAAFKEAIKSSDRTAAIVIFALIDDIIIASLKHHMNPKIKGGTKSLFEKNGLLSSANSRITLSAALYWINPQTYHDINILRTIRNNFAHHIDYDSFEHKTIKGLISSINHQEKRYFLSMSKVLVELSSLSVREIFLVRALAVTNSLCMDCMKIPFAISNKVDPDHMFSTSYELLPDQIKDILRAFSYIILSIAGHEDVKSSFEEKSSARSTQHHKKSDILPG